MLNPEQQVVVETILKHLTTTGGDPFLVVKGPAGTGKTFCVKTVMRDFKRKVVFTAPTNKAVRVLKEVLLEDDYRPPCKTIYSLLGLQMGYNGEIKELAKPEEDIDLSEFAAVFIDEAGMVNRQLMEYIREASDQHHRLRWVFMGDPFQLPPVKEVQSPVWELPQVVELVKIMRQDNQILTLSQHLREMVSKPFGQIKLNDDNDGEEGVWSFTGGRLDQAIINQAQPFLKGESKAIAWRNLEVDRLNKLIREQLFEQAVGYPWQKGDRITLLEPAFDFLDEKKKAIVITDEEGTVEDCQVASHPGHSEFQCFRIVMRSDMNQSLTLWVLHPRDKGKFDLRVARLAEMARIDRSQWKAYWEFRESFHAVRHAYAITAHRAQGSTYLRTFVSWRDILKNQNRGEAMRCLYVAATRPKKELYLG